MIGGLTASRSINGLKAQATQIERFNERVDRTHRVLLVD
jgi:hypothetical protein